MSQTTTFIITDVFCEKKYSGNQLATFLDANNLSDREMQQIAREINFSETTFVLSGKPERGGYNTRIFTPAAEVDFAGHPTLGTAFVIQKHLLKKETNRIVLNLKAGQVPVDFVGRGHNMCLWMHQIEPMFGEILGPDRIADILSLRIDDIDTRWPVEEVSTGLPHLIVPLKSLDVLKRVCIQKDGYDSLIENTWAKIILTFCMEGYTARQKLGVRVFPIAYGIQEDPATGSGNGCLAAYLVKNGCFQSESIDLAAGQGYEIDRPSTLFLKAGIVKGKIHVSVGGRVVQVANGSWG